VRNRSEMVWHGYTFAMLMFINSFIQSMFLHQYFHRCMVVGMRIRTALISAVYRKVPFVYGECYFSVRLD
jgi:hypothetical protein